MKNKTISIFMMLVLVSTLFFGLAVTPVMGASGDITLEDWDDYNTGVFSGVGEYFTWERTLGNDFEIVETYVTSPGKSLMLHANGADVDTGFPDAGYLNLTGSIPYIGQISVVFNVTQRQTVAGAPYRCYFSYYDANDSLVLEIRWDSDNDLDYKDALGSYNELTSNAAGDIHSSGSRLVVTHLGGMI